MLLEVSVPRVIAIGVSMAVYAYRVRVENPVSLLAPSLVSPIAILMVCLEARGDVRFQTAMV
jgi:hypothetical protein